MKSPLAKRLQEGKNNRLYKIQQQIDKIMKHLTLHPIELKFMLLQLLVLIPLLRIKEAFHHQEQILLVNNQDKPLNKNKITYLIRVLSSKLKI